MVDGVDYLSMLATGNRGSLPGPVDVLLPHIGRTISRTGFSFNDAVRNLGRVNLFVCIASIQDTYDKT